jgi:mannosyltransferase OCH1-like enzyme
MATRNGSQNSQNSLAENRIIQGLWVGAELSVMEQLSISSFLSNGHEYHLYVYDDVKDVPVGTTVKDGNEILPASGIFQYRGRPSYAGFSNFFRYKLLFERGGWWADTDTVCLKPFDFSEEYVFSSEMFKGAEVVNCGAVKAPVGSEVMRWAWEVCQRKDTGQIVWGETGPKLIAEGVRKFSLEGYKQPPHVFCPLGFFEWQEVIEPDSARSLDGAYAIHLWNDKWRAAGQDKNAPYEEDCLYEKLKRRYLTSA